MQRRDEGVLASDQGDEENGRWSFADDFDEADMIEARIREMIFMERDLASYLRDLGVPSACVVIRDLEETPMIDIAGLGLTVDEASDLITRLDPKWKGYACERAWDTLPTDDTLELYMKREEGAKKKREEEERKKREQEDIRRKADKVIVAKREVRRQQRSGVETPKPEPESTPPQSVVRELEFEKSASEPVAQESEPVAPKLASKPVAQSRPPHPVALPENPEIVRRQSIADAIAVMRTRKKRRKG